jgi:transposase
LFSYALKPIASQPVEHRCRLVGEGERRLSAAIQRSGPFYKRLIASGKKKMVALVACMRKLLVILNAILKHGTPWRAVERAA